MRGKWLDYLIGFAIYAGIALLVVIALSPILLFITAESGSITVHPCDPEFSICEP
jgi:hypothetical protein